MMVSSFKTEIEKLYEEYSDLLYRLALSHSANAEDASDAVQDVFLKYATSPRLFLDEEHRRAWFIRVTINRCNDIYRKNKVRDYTPLDELYDVPSEENGISKALKEMLDSLPENFKSVIVLHYLEGFSVEETANILKLSVSAVKMRLNRARDFVKSSYNKEDFYD